MSAEPVHLPRPLSPPGHMKEEGKGAQVSPDENVDGSPTRKLAPPPWRQEV